MSLEKICENLNRLEARANTKLVKARENSGLTQEEAAEKIGISKIVLCAYERSKMYPSEKTQDKICSFYCLSKEDLFPSYLRFFSRKRVSKRAIPKEKIISLHRTNQKLLPSYNPEEEIFKKLTHEKLLYNLTSLLPSKEREVIEYRFGLNDKSPCTLEETGKLFGITPERARQIEVNALRRMRYHVGTKK